MRAVTVADFGGPESIRISEVPIPTPEAGQVLIKVMAAAINPVDVAMRSGVVGSDGEPIGLGWDVAGTVTATGEGVDWPNGSRVIGLATNHIKRLGTHADYVVLDAEAIAPAPKPLDDVAAATLPMNTLSAAQALGILGLQPGQRIIVTGAAGAVGAHAVELAAHEGVEVTGVASATDEGFLRSRGARDFIARGDELPDAYFDGVLDAAGLGLPAMRTVSDGGAYIGLWPGSEPEVERNIRISALDVQADGQQLARLSQLVDDGVIVSRVSSTHPLEAAAAAHSLLAVGGLRGRIVLIP